ncbi:MAG TPA: AbrB/MazE/SpoVT family DNA-binding domain-containing protein [Candidatus Hydrogenedentes bacterium]|nr:AbrB/MazE/SpoVT family DNA-binding domain-containing protein [Candidatus Hydrogenedentota bacterium]
MKAIVTDRGQVTIPKALRDRLGIHPRTVLEFSEENGRLIVKKVPQTDSVTQVLGCLTLNKPTDELLNEMRGNV